MAANNKITNPYETIITPRSIGYKSVVFVMLLICSLVVFLFGPNYYQLFPTNGNTIYAASLSAVFLIAALLFKRSTKFAKYWGIAYALFVASIVNLVSDLFGGYYTDFVQLFGIESANKTEGLAKLYDTLLVVIPIIVLTLRHHGRVCGLPRRWG